MLENKSGGGGAKVYLTQNAPGGDSLKIHFRICSVDYALMTRSIILYFYIAQYNPLLKTTTAALEGKTDKNELSIKFKLNI